MLLFLMDKTSDTHSVSSVLAFTYTINAQGNYLPSHSKSNGLTQSSLSVVQIPSEPIVLSHLPLPFPTPRPVLTAPGIGNGLLGFSSTLANLFSSGMPSAVVPTFLREFGTIVAVISPLLSPYSCHLRFPQQGPFSPLVSLTTYESYLHRFNPRATPSF